MRKPFIINCIYALSMTLIIVMRILVSEGVFNRLGDDELTYLWSGIVQALIMGVIPLSLFLIYLKSQKTEKPLTTLFREFGYSRNISSVSWLIVLLISLLSTFVITSVSNVWYSFITLIGYKEAISSPEIPYSAATLIGQIFFTACMPAVFEEFTNRGLLYSALNPQKRPWKTILVTALMFALMHTNIKQVAYTFVFGIITASVVFMTKSIWPAMFIHFVNNLIAVLRTFGRLNDNFFNYINVAYSWLFGRIEGGVVAVLLFIVIGYFLYYLIVKLGDRESERRLALNLPEYGEEVIYVHGQFDNLPLIFASILNLLVTVFTLVWGIIR